LESVRAVFKSGETEKNRGYSEAMEVCKGSKEKRIGQSRGREGGRGKYTLIFGWRGGHTSLIFILCFARRTYVIAIKLSTSTSITVCKYMGSLTQKCQCDHLLRDEMLS